MVLYKLRIEVIKNTPADGSAAVALLLYAILLYTCILYSSTLITILLLLLVSAEKLLYSGSSPEGIFLKGEGTSLGCQCAALKARAISY